MYSKKLVSKLAGDIINAFPELWPPQEGFHKTRSGVSRLVMLDRYSTKDLEHKTTSKDDLVLFTVATNPKFPARAVGYIKDIFEDDTVVIEVDSEFAHLAPGGKVIRKLNEIDKPLELFFEQIALRVGLHLMDDIEEGFDAAEQMQDDKIIPAGRILHGAGSDSEVTYFNCYVLPFPHDSRDGIGTHRIKTMEIMSRGGGVGTNGSTLRPRNAIARGVNGRSSGAVSWLNDIANLTNLVQQGGSRRGAQMIMLNSDHPDIIEFIISKVQNPDILRKLIAETEDNLIRQMAQEKLKFSPLSHDEKETYSLVAAQGNGLAQQKAKKFIEDGGKYSVHNPDFLTGANISVCMTNEFMEAIENDELYNLRFPDLDDFYDEERNIYDKEWHEIGDVRVWEEQGLPTKVYHKVKAKALWELITLCATYSAEPGIFFIDNANKMTNAQSYGQKVVATNPCGEQPLVPYSVCNLLAINLDKFVDDEGNLLIDELAKTTRIAVRLGDQVITKTPYFLEENKQQAQGERRIGLGVMGLADLLIKMGVRYGSAESIDVIEKVFSTMRDNAYDESVELAKEYGPFKYYNDSFVDGGFASTLPEEIKARIYEYGIRNSHLLTVAPTGSTGTMVNVSTGLEPYFAFNYYRNGRLGESIEVKAPIAQEYLDKHNVDVLPDFFVTAQDIEPMDHVVVQCAIQKYVDSSISKTVNAPQGYTPEDVAKIYMELYKGGAKGGTVYVDGSRDSQVLELKPKAHEPTVKPLEETTVGQEEQCPVCHEGKLVNAGGCMTCTVCKAQTSCGL